MERRVREVGRSECFRESRKIEPETWLKPKTGKPQAPVNEPADVQLVSRCERIWRTFEDEKANDGPTGDSYMFLETMGFFAAHPNIPNYMVRVAYSYRYIKGHEDPLFKKKAKWVFDQFVYKNQ